MKKVSFNKLEGPSKRKTATRTFRINIDWEEILKQEAEDQGISVSSLLNQILRQFCLYSRWDQHIKTINVSKQTFTAILNSVPIETLIEVGKKSGSLDPINIINIIGLAKDYRSFVYLLSEYFGDPYFAKWFSCFYHKHENNDLFHLQHDFGIGWSIFLENYFHSFLKSITDANIKTKTYEYAITLKIPTSKNKL